MDRAVCFKRNDLRLRQRREQLHLFVKNTGSVCHKDHLVRTQSFGNIGRSEIGIDVVTGMTQLGIGGDRCDDRDELLCDHLMNDIRVDRSDGTRQSPFGMFFGFSLHEMGIFTVDTDGLGTMRVQQRDDLIVHFTTQYHLYDTHHLRCCHALTLNELCRDLKFGKHLRNTRTAAMHDDRTQSYQVHQQDILCKLLFEFRRGLCRTAILDDNDLVAEFLDKRQCL